MVFSSWPDGWGLIIISVCVNYSVLLCLVPGSGSVVVWCFRIPQGHWRPCAQVPGLWPAHSLWPHQQVQGTHSFFIVATVLEVTDQAKGRGTPALISPVQLKEVVFGVFGQLIPLVWEKPTSHLSSLIGPSSCITTLFDTHQLFLCAAY